MFTGCCSFASINRCSSRSPMASGKSSEAFIEFTGKY
jgi:hypothetical protein